MVHQIIIFINIGIALATSILLPIFGNVSALEAAEILLKLVLAAGYVALAWATSRNNVELKTALFVHLAVVYIAMAICSGMPYLDALFVPDGAGELVRQAES